RVGAGHDGGADGDPGRNRRIPAGQADPLFRDGHGRDGAVGGRGRRRLRRPVPRLGGGARRRLLRLPRRDAALGLLISALATTELAASQAALIAAFLPAFLLSGFLFEIDSMPAPIRLITRVLPARYFVSSLQTLFLVGDVPEVLVPDTLALMAIAAALNLLL